MNQEEQNFADLAEINYEKRTVSSNDPETVLELPSFTLSSQSDNSFLELPDSFSFSDDNASPLPLPDFNLSSSNNISENDSQSVNSSLEETARREVPGSQNTLSQSALPESELSFTEEQKEQEQHIVFTLDEMFFSIPIHNVTEVSRPLPITYLPNVPSWILGISNFRGDIISVVDLKVFFGRADDEVNRKRRMLIVHSTDNDMMTALMVDQVRHIHYLTKSSIASPAISIGKGVSQYVRGVYEHNGQSLILLNPDSLLLSKEMLDFEATTGGN